MNTMRDIHKRHFAEFFRKMLPTLCILALFLAGIVGYGYMMYQKVDHVTAKVVNITQQQNVSGDKDHFSTTYTYIVSTDKGVFNIQPDGLFASSAFGTLEKGKTYRFEVRGGRSDFMGIFPYIIKADEEPQNNDTNN